jgi:hypothetical protein
MLRGLGKQRYVHELVLAVSAREERPRQDSNPQHAP